MIPVGTEVATANPYDFDGIQRVVDHETDKYNGKEYNVLDSGGWWLDDELVIVKPPTKFKPGDLVNAPGYVNVTILEYVTACRIRTATGLVTVLEESNLIPVPRVLPKPKFALGGMVRPKGFLDFYPVKAMKLEPDQTILYQVNSIFYREEYLEADDEV